MLNSARCNSTVFCESPDRRFAFWPVDIQLQFDPRSPRARRVSAESEIPSLDSPMNHPQKKVYLEAFSDISPDLQVGGELAEKLSHLRVRISWLSIRYLQPPAPRASCTRSTTWVSLKLALP